MTPEPSADVLCDVALQMWRSSGRRTETRRNGLIEQIAIAFYGPRVATTHADLLAAAHLAARQRTRIDELEY